MTNHTHSHDVNSSRLSLHNPQYFDEGRAALQGEQKPDVNPYSFGQDAFSNAAWNAGFRSVSR
jgi:hypothetical protein